MDQTVTIRASVSDTERTLIISVMLVILVVFVFLRNGRDDLHSERRRPRVAGGDIRRDVSAGLQPRQSFADGAHHLDWFRGRRRNCRDREHHALSGTGPASIRSRAQRRAGSRLYRIYHQCFADCGVHSAALDGRHRGPPVSRIRGDALGRHRGFHGGFAHRDSHDVRPSA